MQLRLTPTLSYSSELLSSPLKTVCQHTCHSVLSRRPS